MPISVRIESRLEYLYAVLEGDWQNDFVLQIIGNVFEEAARLSARRIIFDALKVPGQLTEQSRASLTYEGVQKYQKLVEAGRMGPCQVVFLLRREMMSPIKIGEMVGNRHGLMLKVTDDLSEAFVWLGITPDQ